MKILRRTAELAQWSGAYRAAALSVGFVPTLGGLHEGHLSLVRQARLECDRVVVSIYLNPAQFDAASDLERYPGDLERDLDACREVGADIVLVGERTDFLPEGFESWVFVEDLTRKLCGVGRPGHFKGVCTVVAQLFHVVRPHRAYFGLKDYQQAKVVSKMAAELLFDVEIRLMPTVRSADGLALSSRNERLTESQRDAATAIWESLQAARELITGGETSVDALKESLAGLFENTGGCDLEYAEILAADTLRDFPGGLLSTAGEGVLVALAVRFGDVRLIDNIQVTEADVAARVPGPMEEAGLEIDGGS